MFIGLYFFIVIGIPLIFCIADAYAGTYSEDNDDIFERMSKELKIWLSIGICLLLINGLFFIPTDGFGEYVTIIECIECDGYLDIQCFIIQTIGIISFCAIGYIIHNQSANYNNPYIQNINMRNNMNDLKTETSSNIEEVKTNVSNNIGEIKTETSRDIEEIQTKISNNIEQQQDRISNNYNMNFQTNNNYALASLICGIVGYFFTIISVFMGVIATALGIMGIVTFNYYVEKNKWFAIAGIVLGIFCILRFFVMFN